MRSAAALLMAVALAVAFLGFGWFVFLPFWARGFWLLAAIAIWPESLDN